MLDLGSGGGGPVVTMLRASLRDNTAMPRVILSDLHPSVPHYAGLQSEFGSDRLGYVEEPVSATSVQHRDIRLRSICSAFHHFTPGQAAELVADATAQADGLFIAEPLQRNLRHLLLVALSGPLPYMLAPFFADGWSWRKLLFCTILPVIPLLVMFDGCVSVLRTYSVDEVIALIPASKRNDFEIRHGVLPYMGIFGSLYVCLSRKHL